MELDEAGTTADLGRTGDAAKACLFFCGGYGRSDAQMICQIKQVLCEERDFVIRLSLSTE